MTALETKLAIPSGQGHSELSIKLPPYNAAVKIISYNKTQPGSYFQSALDSQHNFYFI